MIDAATTVLSVVVGDMNYDLTFILQDGSGTVIDLTGATGTFFAQLVSDFGVKFSGAITVSDAANGKCKYTVQAADFPVAGVYSCQVAISYLQVNEKITFDNIEITAVSRVPQ